jgi:histidine phosphotransfer protein HptB
VTADGSIDQKVLTRLSEGTGGDEGFVSELIEQFVTEAPDLVAAMRTGFDAGDPDGVRRAAHTLKSNAATFGANELAAGCAALEDAAKRGELGEAAASLDAIARQLDVVRAALPETWRGLSATAP